MRSARSAFFLGTFAVSALAACSLLVGVKDEEDLKRPDAAPPDATLDAGPPDVDPCPHAGPPPAPTTGAASPEVTHAFAVRKVFLGGLRDAPDSGPPVPTAYDFDRICSCENHDERVPGLPRTSCVLPNGAELCSPSAGPLDDPEGRDLGAVNAFRSARPFVQAIEDNDVNPIFNNGNLGFLLQVDGYNETADDPKVLVRVYSSIGIARVGDAGRDGSTVCRGADPGVVKPSWNGAKTDVWFASSGSASASEGYVTGGQLVVNGTAASYFLPVGGGVLKQSKSIFVGQLTKQDGGVGYLLRGNLVGLVSASNLLGVIGTFRSPLSAARLCEDPVGFPLFKSPLCASRDLLESSTDPNRPCDSIAFVVGIEAEEVSAESPTAPCGPLNADGGDLCDAQCP